MSWNNRGGPFDVVATPIASFTAPAQPSTTYVATLPKSFISTHAGGLVSVQLDTTATDDLVFASRESTNSTARPQLVVAYR
jgi:hypothetical protein